MEVTVQVEIVQTVFVALAQIMLVSPVIAPGEAGVKPAVNVLPHTNQVVMLMPNAITQMDLMMLDFSKLMILTGMHVTVVILLVILTKILVVLKRYMLGEVILGNYGLHVANVDVVTLRKKLNGKTKK